MEYPISIHCWFSTTTAYHTSCSKNDIEILCKLPDWNEDIFEEFQNTKSQTMLNE